VDAQIIFEKRVGKSWFMPVIIICSSGGRNTFFNTGTVFVHGKKEIGKENII
jgi:hypothetical protein